jgi:MinD superfamily P-loop ATPase
LATTDHFGVQLLMAINRVDLNPGRSNGIAAFCAEQGIDLVGRIPYDTVVTEVMIQGHPVTEHADGPVTEAMQGVRTQVRKA